MLKKVLILSSLVIIIGLSILFIKHLKPQKIHSENNVGVFIDVTSEDLKNKDKDDYVLFAYNYSCTMQIPCEDIFQEFMKNEKIDFLRISIDEYKKTDFYKKVKYVPTVLVIKSGKIVAYLDANKDEDLIKYQDVNEFKKWISNYIYLATQE